MKRHSKAKEVLPCMIPATHSWKPRLTKSQIRLNRAHRMDEERFHQVTLQSRLSRDIPRLVDPNNLFSLAFVEEHVAGECFHQSHVGDTRQRRGQGANVVF